MISGYVIDIVMSSLVFLVYLVNNLNNYVKCFFIIIIPEKPHWGGSKKYVCMYTMRIFCRP